MSDCCHCYGCKMSDSQEHNILNSSLKYNGDGKQCKKNCLKKCKCYGCRMGDSQEHEIITFYNNLVNK